MALALRLTDSPTAVGGILTLRLLPAVIGGPLAARAVQKWDRRNTMLAMDVARAVLIALVPLIRAIWWIYVLGVRHRDREHRLPPRARRVDPRSRRRGRPPRRQRTRARFVVRDDPARRGRVRGGCRAPTLVVVRSSVRARVLDRRRDVCRLVLLHPAADDAATPRRRAGARRVGAVPRGVPHPARSCGHACDRRGRVRARRAVLARHRVRARGAATRPTPSSACSSRSSVSAWSAGLLVPASACRRSDLLRRGRGVAASGVVAVFSLAGSLALALCSAPPRLAPRAAFTLAVGHGRAPSRARRHASGCWPSRRSTW